MNPSLLATDRSCSVEMRWGHDPTSGIFLMKEKIVNDKYYLNNVSYKFKSNVWGMWPLDLFKKQQTFQLGGYTFLLGV